MKPFNSAPTAAYKKQQAKPIMQSIEAFYEASYSVQQHGLGAQQKEAQLKLFISFLKKPIVCYAYFGYGIKGFATQPIQQHSIAYKPAHNLCNRLLLVYRFCLDLKQAMLALQLSIQRSCMLEGQSFCMRKSFRKAEYAMHAYKKLSKNL